MSRWPAAVVRAAAAAALLFGGVAGGPTYAQSAPSTSIRQTLSGHAIPSLARAAALQPTDASRRLSLSIALQPRNQAQLAALIQQQGDPSSPSYHAYLSPEQYTLQFGPTQASVDAVTAFLVSQGLHVDSVSPNRLLIQASGSVEAIQRAFQVQLQDFSVHGLTVHAPVNEPSVPAPLGGVVQGIMGLDNIAEWRPHVQRGTNTAKVGSGPFGSGYTPAELRAAYDMTALPTGAGQTVAVVEFDGYEPSDIGVFLAQYGLPPLDLTNRPVDGATTTPSIFGGSAEVELDIEVLAGIAPSAAQRVYLAPNTRQGGIDLYNAIVTDNMAKVVSSSWGSCEQQTTAAERATMSAILAQAVVQGMAVYSAAGDNGAFDCQGDGVTLAVDHPASDPNVVSVGGTRLLTGPGGTYQSESVWNDLAVNQGAGGGGLSVIFPLAPYQLGPGVQNGFSNGKRELPDVSANADPQTPYSMYCTELFGCGGAGWIGIGGTSAATPLWAGLTADINQYLAALGKPGIGNAHSSLYMLFNTPQRWAPYHDITDGNNGHYPATPGFDLASGIGTPDGLNIAQDLASATAGSSLVTTFGPVRLVDTRTAGGAIPSGATRCFPIAGLGPVPADASAVVLSVAAVGQAAPGWVTVFPNGQPLPATSTLNFDRTQYAIANNTLMRVGGGDQVCANVGTVNNQPGSAHVVLDVTGYVPSNGIGQLSMLPSPMRAIDTRLSGGPIPSSGTRCFVLAGVGGVPADAAAVVLNVTAVGYTTPGWVTAFPNGQAVPATSTLNFDRTEYAVANGAIVRVGAGGQVCTNVGTVNNQPGSSQVVLDVTGYLASSGAGRVPMLTSPARVVDTRLAGGPIAGGTSRCVALAGVPANATAAILNVTAVGYSTRGWLTVYPAGQALPATSTLNFDTTEYAMANGAILQLGPGGQLCVNVGTVDNAPGSAHVVLDLVGYLAP